MEKKVALITGAGGEMGRLLLPELHARGYRIVALDLAPLPDEVRRICIATTEMNILDTVGLTQLIRRHSPSLVFHLAAVLSSHAERDPELAHRVNVDGTLGLYKICCAQREYQPAPIRLLLPSSIAVYGLPDLATKSEQGAVKEWQWTEPSGIYGCNKLYCELMGSYLAARGAGPKGPALDFRGIRFPGLISAETLPTGGTTDYAPEMIHAAARSESYSCFVRGDSTLPFMTMPDAVEALLRLASTERSRLTKSVYNIRGFSASAGTIRSAVIGHFPKAQIDFEPSPARQAIVDSWPEDVDDSKARNDWGLSPRHDLPGALSDYLVPALSRRYST